ncbi:acyl-CoA:lysophosphatidylglycerol acyltransferase 1-like isoform X2 [Planococcus citri]|uniref:acyl-CoA:lysophosphatidylglycerol acyltransferase 1-like isoform X2 n=1 Tax=Planococcus citri TaxID=170843 RepID=UPI0031F96633
MKMGIEELDKGICTITYRLFVAVKVVIRVIFVLLNNVYCIPTYCVWMLMLLPLRKLYPPLYWKMEGLFFHWLLAMVTMWSWTAGYDLVEVGDDIRVCLDDRTLVVVNHQSTSDVPMLMANFNARRNVLPNIMWIMDWIFKLTNFGIVSIIHQDFFILSGKKQRDKGVKELRAHLRESYIPRKRKLMVLFPEGGFLRKRRETSQKYAMKNNLPVLNYVTLPRLGAFHAIIDELTPLPVTKYGSGKEETNTYEDSEDKSADKLSWVLDITIAYPGGVPLDLPTIIMGYRRACKTYLCYRLYPASQVPRDHETMTKWLFDRWAEKERMLETFYQTGEFPYQMYCSSEKPLGPQLVHQDFLRFFILHVFFIASSCAHYWIFVQLWSLI